ncbi:MAG: hypothetical protein PHP04_15160, partial [Bacteroidales bacterium]|nr:hypothetical protein [Bacteroidales bacterium]
MKKMLFLLLGISMMAIAPSCKKKSTDPEIVYYYASAQIRGTAVNFKTTATFSKLCVLTGVCNTF